MKRVTPDLFFIASQLWNASICDLQEPPRVGMYGTKVGKKKEIDMAIGAEARMAHSDGLPLADETSSAKRLPLARAEKESSS